MNKQKDEKEGQTKKSLTETHQSAYPYLTPVLISLFRTESFHGCLQVLVNLTSGKC